MPPHAELEEEELKIEIQTVEQKTVFPSIGLPYYHIS